MERRYEYFLQPRQNRCAVDSGNHLVEFGPETFGFNVLPGKRKWPARQEGRLRAIEVVSLYEDQKEDDDLKTIDIDELVGTDRPESRQNAGYFIQR